VSGDRAILIRNEQAKLTATYLNGIGIALAAVGGIAPWIASAETLTISPLRAVLTLACFVTSSGLHLVARRVLARMVV
jgi:hypothetical protein